MDLEKRQQNLLEKTAALAKRSLVYDTEIPDTNHETATKEQLGQSEQKLKQQCEDLASQLQQLQKELCDTQKATTVRKGDPSLAVAEAKYRQLQSSIEVIKQSKPEGYSGDQVALQELIMAELETSQCHLQDVLAHVRSQLKHLQQKQAQEERMLSQHMEVHQALERRLEEESSQPDHQMALGRSLGALEKKKQMANDFHKKLMKQMAGFLQKNYPLPSEEDMKKWHKKMSTRTGAKSAREILPLITILEELMNKHIECAHDPYIETDDRYWPPYVELLLRCGVALRHKDQDNRIKITPFQL